MYGAKYSCADKFSFYVHLKAIRAYDVDIVNSTEETDQDRQRLKTYRRILRALGLMAEDYGSSVTNEREKRTEAVADASSINLT